jgi:hypothetical protein
MIKTIISKKQSILEKFKEVRKQFSESKSSKKV